MRHHAKYLLVGCGIASSAAAAAIRRLDPAGGMVMVGQEASRPYRRPLLTVEYLLGAAKRDALFTQTESWFVENRIEIRTGRRAARLDPGQQTVFLDDGHDVVYDRLLIATGASPRRHDIPGADLPNLFYPRTLDDTDRLHNAIEKARAEGRPQHGDSAKRGRVAVLGGDLLVVEIAATLTTCGLEVELLLPADHPWTSFAGPVTGRFVATALRNGGVRITPGVHPAAIEGDGRVQRIRLATADGTELIIHCDLAVGAIGQVANKELARGTSIAAEQAILTDQHCRTNIAEVFAAGDCAAVFDPRFGKHRIMNTWEAAQATGEVAGINMAGGDATFQEVNHFTSRAMGIDLNAWGEPRLVDRRIIRDGTGGRAGGFIEIGVAADGRIAQILAINHPADHDILADLVARRPNVNGNANLLKDPSSDLRRFLA